MFNQFHPNVKATLTFLKLLKLKVNGTTLNETLQNHPEWPSLLCITDTLEKWHIPNGAGRTIPGNIDELPVPFIASLNNDMSNPIAVVSRVTHTTVELYHKNYNTPITESKDDFKRRWSGIYLIAEPDENSGEPNYEANKKKAFRDGFISVAAIASVALLSLLLMCKSAGGFFTSAPAIGVYLQYLVMLSGVVVSGMLLWYEIDKNNPLLKKVCTGIANGDCGAILSGKQAKVFSWLSWSEVGFFYFAGGLFTLLFAGTSLPQAIAVVAWLNILALPYTLFSVYYQWRVAKQWCVLCLVVQALLVLGGVNVITTGLLLPLPQFNISFIAGTALLYMAPALVWYALKPHILRLQKSKDTQRQYLRIKFNTEIFDTLLKKQKPVMVPTDGLGIDLGNPNAKHTLIKVCSTFCGPCSEAHPKIEKLLHENEDLKVKIIFSVSDNEEDAAVKAVRHLLAIAEKGNEAGMQKALDDWYLPNDKNYDSFAARYPMNGELVKQADKVGAMNNWCKEMGITHTPTIFIDGYELPDAYDIGDLQYFLTEASAAGDAEQE